MEDALRRTGAGHADAAAPELTGDVFVPPGRQAPEDDCDDGEEAFEETLLEEASAMIDDAGTYLEAEIAFQKTRAKLAGRHAGASAGFAIVALILLHIALLALAVGLVIALAPLVTIWGAILIVVGALLVLTALLGWMALKRVKKLGNLFSGGSNSSGEGADNE